jgi:phage internal scaffolding protein
MSHLKPINGVVIRSTYSPKLDVSLGDFEPTLTKQCFQDECDIDNILKRYAETGVLEHVREHKGNYGDFLNVQDYHVSVSQVVAAQEMFMSMPAQIRARFKNDPGEFLDFVNNPDNQNEMVKLGLAEPREEAQKNFPAKPVEGGSDEVGGGG